MNEEKWIPSYIKLPTDNKFVIGQTKGGDAMIMKYEEFQKSWYTYEECSKWPLDMIVAWRPLPEPYKGPKNERDFSGSSNPYKEIADYIVNNSDNILDDYIVKIKLDNYILTDIFSYDGETCVWLNDWYEGEENIELIDFFPLSEAVKKEK